MYLSVLKRPKLPSYLNAENAELNRSVVNVETMAQKKICHDSFMFQNEDTSSMEKSKPPTGAPKAEATPAAAPAEMKFLLKRGLVTFIWSFVLGFTSLQMFEVILQQDQQGSK